MNPQQGGKGVESSIAGSPKFYAGGGSGGWNCIGACPGGARVFGGRGGGGASGKDQNSDGDAGTANTGGGGAGGGYTSGANDGAGGSGIVVIKYPGTTPHFDGGTISFVNGHIVHTFTSSSRLNRNDVCVTADTSPATYPPSS